jgi:signal peptidase II
LTNKKKAIWLGAVIAGVIILDQVFKIWVKLNMNYGEEFPILGLSWARIHFVENEGMAFGITFGGDKGKIFLSVFRILAVTFIGYILYRLLKNGESLSLLISLGLIFAGAMGNIIDSAFYGLIFSESPYFGPTAELFPEDGGYAPFLMGKVVDMLYFPMIDTRWPEWVPLLGGDRFQFFKPVFNIADSAITAGVISIILFHRSFFQNGPIINKPKKDPEEEE